MNYNLAADRIVTRLIITLYLQLAFWYILHSRRRLIGCDVISQSILLIHLVLQIGSYILSFQHEQSIFLNNSMHDNNNLNLSQFEPCEQLSYNKNTVFAQTQSCMWLATRGKRLGIVVPSDSSTINCFTIVLAHYGCETDPSPYSMEEPCLYSVQPRKATSVQCTYYIFCYSNFNIRVQCIQNFK